MKARFTISTLFAVVLCAAMMAVSACAPAAGTVGLDIGKTTPPYAMALPDGSQVTSDALAEADQPVHLFWFATW